MNGAQKRTKHIWKGLRGKKYRYLTVAILCVSLIMAASMLMLYLGGQKDERRYQSESYELLEQNTTDFNKLFGRTEGFVRNLMASLDSLDWFAAASQEEIAMSKASIPRSGANFTTASALCCPAQWILTSSSSMRPIPTLPSAPSAAANTSFSPETRRN